MDEVAAARRAVKSAQEWASVRRGMIRYVVVVVDCSMAMDLSTDGAFQPDRWSVVVAKMTDFIREFLKQNPLSYVQLISMQNCKAIKLTDFSGIDTAHCYALAALKPSGEASLQIALAEACSSLRLAPSYSTREILVLHSTTTTCDPADIFTTVAAVKKLRVRCSVLSISCEVYIFRHVSQETNGDFHVCQDPADLIETLRRYITPLETLDDGTPHNAAFVRMGFPTQKVDAHASLCITTQTFEREGYDCPQCKTKVHQLPVRCPICGLALVLSSHLARSYHHLSPLQEFERPIHLVPPEQLCFACKEPAYIAETGGENKVGGAATTASASGPGEAGRDGAGRSSSSRASSAPAGGGGGGSGGGSGGETGGKTRPGAKQPPDRAARGGPRDEDDDYEDDVYETDASIIDRFYECPLCKNLFCEECNDFIHHSLHNCPGCL
jgi:transcription initiation factor TFIIH subunit 2